MIGLLASPAAGAGVQLRITKWELNTIHDHKRTVHSGATIAFCASDPYYRVSPFFTWRGVPLGAVMTLTLSQPRLKATTSHPKTFEAAGQNADTISAAHTACPRRASQRESTCYALQSLAFRQVARSCSSQLRIASHRSDKRWSHGELVPLALGAVSRRPLPGFCTRVTLPLAATY